MIGLQDDNGVHLSIAYNGLTLNADADTVESTTEGAGPSTYVIDAIAPRTALDYTLEPNQQRSGVEIYNPRKAARVVTLRGRILAKSFADLYDRIEDLAVAFDPDNIAWFYGDADMFLPLTFSTPTLDTVNYPTGLMACEYFAIPAAMPEPVIGPEGQSATFHVDMLMRDPRRYLQTTDSLVGNGTITNIGDFRSWPTISATVTGHGSATFTVAVTGTQGTNTLVLDLSSNTGTTSLSIDCENSAIYVDSVETPGWWVSGSYPEINAGSNTITFSNTTNTTSRTVTYRPAFSS